MIIRNVIPRYSYFFRSPPFRQTKLVYLTFHTSICYAQVVVSNKDRNALPKVTFQNIHKPHKNTRIYDR